MQIQIILFLICLIWSVPSLKLEILWLSTSLNHIMHYLRHQMGFEAKCKCSEKGFPQYPLSRRYSVNFFHYMIPATIQRLLPWPLRRPLLASKVAERIKRHCAKKVTLQWNPPVYLHRLSITKIHTFLSGMLVYVNYICTGIGNNISEIMICFINNLNHSFRLIVHYSVKLFGK